MFFESLLPKAPSQPYSSVTTAISESRIAFSMKSLISCFSSGGDRSSYADEIRTPVMECDFVFEAAPDHRLQLGK